MKNMNKNVNEKHIYSIGRISCEYPLLRVRRRQATKTCASSPVWPPPLMGNGYRRDMNLSDTED
jgi:hypothetical protein